MSSELATIGAQVEAVLIAGDLSKLSADQRVNYYKNVCESVGLNPLTKPFDYLTLNGKMVLYAKRDATDQLRKIHGVSLKITDRQTFEGVYIVSAQATDRSGRTDESTGAVNIAGLKGEALANAYMKAETKSKRRVTLSICGLGLLDETEVETIPNARTGEHPASAPARQPPPQGGQHDSAPAIDFDLVEKLETALRGAETRGEFDMAASLVKVHGKKDELTPAGIMHLRDVYAEMAPKWSAKKKPAAAVVEPEPVLTAAVSEAQAEDTF